MSPATFATLTVAGLAQPNQLLIDSTGSHLYVSYLNTNHISYFPINADGTLDVASRFDYVAGAGNITTNLAFSPNGQILIVDNPSDHTVLSFQINADGTLNAKSTMSVGNGGGITGVFDTTGACLFSGDNGADHGGIFQFRVAADGTLSAAPTAQVNVGGSDSIPTVTPDQKYIIYETDFPTNGGYAVYTVDSTLCNLTAVSGSPFYFGNGAVRYSSLAFTKSAAFAVTTSENSNVMISMSYNSATGELSQIDSVSTGTTFTFAPFVLSIPQQ